MLSLNELEAGMQLNPHVHDEFDQLAYILEGTADYYIGDDAHRMGPGSMLLVPAKAVHHIELLHRRRVDCPDITHLPHSCAQPGDGGGAWPRSCRRPQGRRPRGDRSAAGATRLGSHALGERCGYLRAVAGAIRDRADEIAALVVDEVGTPRSLARIMQCAIVAQTFENAADEMEAQPLRERIGNSQVVREPIGVVAASRRGTSRCINSP